MQSVVFKTAARAVAQVLLAGLLCAAALPAHGAEEAVTVVVVGTAPVQGGNAAAAREAALASAMMQAVALAAVETLTPEGFAERFKKLDELLLERPDAFIQDFKVLAESATAKQHRVLVQATVLGRRIRDQAAAAAPAAPRPVSSGGILLLIAEHDPDRPSGRYWWGREGYADDFAAEAAAARALRERNFAVLDARVVRRQENVDWGAYDRPVLTPAEAAALGRNLNAELVVLGKVSVSPEAGTAAAGAKSFRGLFEARLVQVENAREVGRVIRSATAADADAAEALRQALAAAGALGGEALAAEITVSRQRRESGSSQVRVSVEGTGNLAHFVGFRKTLAGVPGVEGVNVKEMKPGATTLLVTFKGGASELAAALRRQAFDGFEVLVVETGEGSLKVTLVAG